MNATHCDDHLIGFVSPSPRRNVCADVAVSFEYQQSINPYAEGLPSDVQTQFDDRYLEFFPTISETSG
ncbi:hypothetical protein [Lunatibacter salilacus]|uniref:hypothetical protein n=1 Tax=Lunatibacter salilacus TaxID=2483804 RepID=UPI001F35007C|nr:hypothetical protein [Lunatibacter salilacus]